MVQAFLENALSEYECTCKHPHFKDPLAKASFGCHEKMRVRLRSASGVYIPITKSALLIPPWSKKVVHCIQKHYRMLSSLVNISDRDLINAIRQDLQDDTIIDAEILRSWDAVKSSMEQKKHRTEQSVLRDEYDVLSKPENNNEENFSSYSVEIPERYAELFEQIAVVDRLTVTQAFTGFTRVTYNESNKVAISQYPKSWLPAIELTGEGIFIRFNKERILAWSRANSRRYQQMESALSDSPFVISSFSAVYVMLHTFAHLFIREISNVCGYSAASIMEKIYCEKNNNLRMCGVLIYVSSSDSDSSLGGLISIADNKDVLENIFNSMLERASWCSGDPLCITSTNQGFKNLNYAACHDCTLLPETSCERFNCLLDRASIIGLPENKSIGFFSSLVKD